jgi:hypothetical protein
MTAIPTQGTLSEVSVTNFPFYVASGTGKRKQLVVLRCTNVNSANTINLATYVPALYDIEGFAWQTLGDVAGTTSHTWSTTTVTFAGGNGVWELGVIVNLV